MTICITKGRSGYTLLEILLAMGLCVIIALVAVPSMEGWRFEHRMRMNADEVISLVQDAKIEAEKTARAQLVVLLPPGEEEPAEAEEGVHFLVNDGAYDWEVIRFEGEVDEEAAIRIDDRGYVEPVSFRVSQGEKFLEFRFDFLTGHAREEAFSF